MTVCVTNPINGTIVASYVLAQFNFPRIRLYLFSKQTLRCYRLTVRNNTNPRVLLKRTTMGVEKITGGFTNFTPQPPTSDNSHPVLSFRMELIHFLASRFGRRLSQIL